MNNILDSPVLVKLLIEDEYEASHLYWKYMADWITNLRKGDSVCVTLGHGKTEKTKIVTKVKKITEANVLTEAGYRFNKRYGTHTGPGVWSNSIHLTPYNNSKMVEFIDFDDATSIAIVIPKSQEFVTILHDFICERFGNDTQEAVNLREVIFKNFGERL